jgi:hypothetical protein
MKRKIKKLEKIQSEVEKCTCPDNQSCTKEENGNGEWKDYCWKCHKFK